MKRPLIRQGEGPDAAYQRIDTERQARQRELEKILAQPVDSSTPSRSTAAGDSRKLRGIPAIARGVSGASPGTNPEHAAIANEERPRRNRP